MVNGWYVMKCYCVDAKSQYSNLMRSQIRILKTKKKNNLKEVTLIYMGYGSHLESDQNT